MNKITFKIILDIIKNKIVIIYAIILMLFSWSVFGIEETANKAFLTLLSLLLLVIPLVSSLFSTIYIYNSSEFIELLLCQPIQRSALWRSLYVGLSSVLILAFLVGVGIPLMLFVDSSLVLSLLLSGSLLTLVFTSISFLCVILSRDKAKGIGISLILWLYFALFFDGIVMFLSFQLMDYPAETFLVLFSSSNPIDLTRIFNLLQIDTSAILGHTGAIFKSYFDTSLGRTLALLAMCIWIIFPFWISMHIFKKKDL